MFGNILLILFILCILYLLSIKPRLWKRPDYSAFRGHLFAHRGLHNMNAHLKEHHSPYYCKGGCFPENSQAAFQRAVEYGYGIELDVHLSKDNIPVVFHDDSLKRICGIDGNLKDYTYQQLQNFRLLGTEQTIPSFADVLALVDGKVPLIIEYKVEKNADKLCSICNDMLLSYKGTYCIESFHPLAVHWYRRHRPDIVRGQLSEDFTRERFTFPFFLLSHLIGNAYAAPDFVAYNCLHYQELSRTLCQKLYRCLSVGWTIRSEDELKQVSPYFDAFIFEDFLP